MEEWRSERGKEVRGSHSKIYHAGAIRVVQHNAPVQQVESTSDGMRDK